MAYIHYNLFHFVVINPVLELVGPEMHIQTAICITFILGFPNITFIFHFFVSTMLKLMVIHLPHWVSTCSVLQLQY